ncbi:oxidoreductase [Solihabitans fulvus]|uniref:Oxidoreductase n=1 Tax=Solihabitans fulvus TaxID=1892852 RepID=A0A5B2XQN8_9PSEU|nr:FAD-dependent oxidoreductase [Solihabitans fulvus]KAA2265254.1 oxidoreductase [Solihabitans fulvus]
MTVRSKAQRIVVVGAGLAGLRAAERLREQGFDGELVIVGEEKQRPYQRPALSKQFLTGALRAGDLALRSYVELDARWRLGTPVHRLEPARHVLHLPGGEELRYDGLVIATGVQARHLDGAPRHDPRVHVLRGLADAVALRDALLGSSGPIAVLGGGFTSCEVAATCRSLGREVHLVSRSPLLLERALGGAMGARLGELHRAHGVRLALGVEVRRWIPQGWSMGMLLSDGQLLLAECVVLAVGGVPAVDWLRGSGLVLEDGILCGPTCHAVGASDIVVAGDVARWPNLRFDAVPRRVEHWLNAVEMGRAAAENLLAGQQSATPFTPLPRFWSEQHGVRLQAAGMPSLGEDTVRLAGRPERGAGIAGYLRDGRLVGLVGQESPRGMLHWTSALAKPAPQPQPQSQPQSQPLPRQRFTPMRQPAASRASLASWQLGRAARSQVRANN